MSQHAQGLTDDLPARVFDDPPVVDIFKGVTGDLLLMGAASPIFIPEHRKQEVTLVKLYLKGF